jgi:Tol biopolymer transport system component
VGRLALAVVLAGCGFQVAGGTSTDGGDREPDAPTGLDADPTIDGSVPLGVWSTPTWVGVTAGADDPTLTADLRELYFNLNDDIYLATRSTASDAWGTPVVVTQLSSGVDTTPEVSADGLTMMLASDRIGTLGSTDLWISTRATRQAAWGMPVLVPELSSPTSEAGPVMTPDRTTIVFTSFRKANVSPDIYVSTRTNVNGPWSTPLELVELNTAGHDGSAVISADRLRICFDSTRGGNSDLYCSTKPNPSAPFPTPQTIPGITTSDVEEDPWLSPDGTHLYFYSSRGGMAGLWESTLQ